MVRQALASQLGQPACFIRAASSDLTSARPLAAATTAKTDIISPYVSSASHRSSLVGVHLPVGRVARARAHRARKDDVSGRYR